MVSNDVLLQTSWAAVTCSSRAPVTPRSLDPCVTALAMWSKRVLGLERGVVSRRSDGTACLVGVCCHKSRTCCTYYGSIAPRNESQAPRSAAEESRDRGAGMHKNGRVRMRPCEDRGKSQDKSGQSSWLSVNVKQSMRTQRADRQREPSQQVTRGWWSYPETQEEGANH